ncbi:4-hydroxy-3-methylbut-2-enyl diphosphate reductase [Collinsella ihumii]|uniref:4-hydroxy-3-methylbut-2-enyl diphosphate reductase n=1 Tax=Collinsella ihumii TaxID=1720204 RepID=A0AAW7JU96_9ACTN|nr:4-hydroxy-3-methylbut-2-enyl diphosphate reductase [Collinsella ihumii]MDN0068180.1 4-hydroxy-3-methylbut-2-enyl diphosphate reductase [Collinsella ihumii]
MARIEIAAHAGVCYGVERALSMAADAATSAPAPVHTLGPLIHNPLVVKELEAQGVGLAETLDDASSGSIIIRAHGVVPAVIEQARARDLTVLDATCPYVKRVHAAAEKLVREGYQLIVVGESGHPEVEGIMGHADGAARVVSCADDLADLEISSRVGVVVQTTQTQATLADVVSALLTRASEVRVINTICSATQERQQAASELASRADVMIVVGGKNSGNTRRLAQICTERCERTHHVEDACEIDPAWFTDTGLIGITAGASTPSSHIERAVKAIMETTGAVDAR